MFLKLKANFHDSNVKFSSRLRMFPCKDHESLQFPLLFPAFLSVEKGLFQEIYPLKQPLQSNLQNLYAQPFLNPFEPEYLKDDDHLSPEYTQQ